jgi:hypothetical protein
VVLDWVTRTAYASSGKGIQWTLTGKLEDLEFADDLALLSHRLQDMQEKVDALGAISQRVGLKINKEKTEVMRINNNQEAPVTIDGRNVNDVEEFVYLGSKISKSGGTEEDIRARINRARCAFTVLRPIWKNSAISNQTKIRILNSNVKAVLLYGAETWRVSKASTAKIQTFMNRCLRQILKLRWQDKVPNIELWGKARQEPITVQIRRRKWRWVGHTLRKDHPNVTRQALEWNPQGKRKRGRPRQTWRRSLLEELKPTGMSWETAKLIAGDRMKWKEMVEALCSIRSKED